MFATQTVALPRAAYSALWEFLNRQGRPAALPAVLAEAVELWLAKQHEAKGRYGYQWKTVFLPEGTVLRSWSYGEHHYAHVKGDQIFYEGRAVSPNQLAQHFGRSTRNAWNDLFIRRPADRTFKQACVLRTEVAREEQALRDARLSATGPSTKAHAEAAAPTQAVPAQPDGDLSPQALAAVVTAVLAQLSPCRDTTPGPGWNLPERRKHRYRLEDILFD